MNNSDDVKLYSSIGSAVIACQAFEFAFALCVKLVFKYENLSKKAEILPLNLKAFRLTSKQLLNELKNQINIDVQFEDHMSQLLERRNHLIHRWVFHNGFPSNEKEKTEMTEYSQKLTADAINLSVFLSKYVLNWMAKYPEMEFKAKEIKQQFENIFKALQHKFQIKKA